MDENNAVEVYKNNTLDFYVNLSGLEDYSDFTAYLTVKKNYHATDALIEKTGTITAEKAEFSIDATDNNIPAGVYYYDVVIESSSEKYTVTQSTYTILKSVKY